MGAAAHLPAHLPTHLRFCVTTVTVRGFLPKAPRVSICDTTPACRVGSETVRAGGFCSCTAMGAMGAMGACASGEGAGDAAGFAKSLSSSSLACATCSCDTGSMGSPESE
jgi:hypothetical protein